MKIYSPNSFLYFAMGFVIFMSNTQSMVFCGSNEGGEGSLSESVPALTPLSSSASSNGLSRVRSYYYWFWVWVIFLEMRPVYIILDNSLKNMWTNALKDFKPRWIKKKMWRPQKITRNSGVICWAVGTHIRSKMIKHICVKQISWFLLIALCLFVGFQEIWLSKCWKWERLSNARVSTKPIL